MKRPSLKRQFLAGIGASTFAQVSTIAIQILLLPVMLHAWGDDKYGAWLVLSAIPTYFGLADFGLTNVLANETTMRMGAGDTRGAVVASQTTWLMMCVVVLILTPIVWALCLWPPVSAGILATGGGPAEIRITLVALAGSAVASLALGATGGAMRSLGQYGVVTTIATLARLAEALALAAAALMGAGFAVAALCSLAARLVVTAPGMIRFYSRHPEFTPNLRHSDFSLLTRLMVPSLGSVAYTVAQLISLQGMVIVVGNLLGASAVVVFSAVRTFARTGRMAAGIANFSLEPILAQIASDPAGTRFKTLQMQMLRHSIVAAAAYFVVAIFVGPIFIPWWTRDVVRPDIWLLVTLVGAASLEIVWMALQTPLMATNRHVVFSLYFLVLSASSLAGFALFAGTLGVFGAGLSALVLSALVLMATHLARHRLGSNS